MARGIRLAAREIEAAIVELSGATDGPFDGGRIVVGAMPLSRALILPHAIAASLREETRTEIVVVEGSWRELIEPLRDGMIDLTIGALRDEAPADLDQRALFTDDIAIVGRAGHPLAGDAAPTLAELAGYGWIVGQAGTPLRGLWDALFAGHALPPTPIECGSVMVIRGVLGDSDLLTLLSPDQVALEVRAGTLATIGPPVPRARRTIGVTTRRDWRPTAAQQRFAALLEDAAVRTRLPKNE